MSFTSRPFLVLPAAVIAAGIAIAFFKVYGAFTRPDVPKPVEELVSHFAPGVAIGKPVGQIKGIGDLTWVQHLGYVSNTPRAGFVQTRLLLSAEDRAKATSDPTMKVEAVELVSMANEMSGTQASFMMMTRAQPKEGCLTPSRDGLPSRGVTYWTTKNDLGGVALITGFAKVDSAALKKRIAAERARAESDSEYRHVMYPEAPPRLIVWSMLIWNGPFAGSQTLRGKFDPHPCGGFGEAASLPSGLAKAALANDSLLAEFDHTAAADRAAEAAAVEKARTDSLTRFADACFGTNLVHTDGWSRRDLGTLPISVLMPAEYSRRARRGDEPADSLMQVFRAPDGSEIWFGRRASRFDLGDVPEWGRETECEATISGVQAHLETGRRLPSLRTKTTSAVYRLPTGAWLVVTASARNAERQQQQLRMIREVQLARAWDKPTINPPRLAIDSL